MRPVMADGADAVAMQETVARVGDTVSSTDSLWQEKISGGQEVIWKGARSS